MNISTLIYSILVIIGCAGFILSFYIRHCKREKQPLVCPLRGSCEFVTSSPYSKFLGVHIELLGMFYYAAIVIANGAILADPVGASLSAGRLSLALATAGFLFSLYLFCVQAFVLKKWCTWCLVSSLFCIAIFVLAYMGAPAGIL